MRPTAGTLTISGSGSGIRDGVISGGVETVYGTESSGSVSSSASLVVEDGGRASSILNEGSATIAAGGFGFDDTVTFYGSETVYGTETSASVGSAGALVVGNGGVLVGATVSSGGTVIVSSGGVADLGLNDMDGGVVDILSGGTVDFGSGATVTSSVVVGSGVAKSSGAIVEFGPATIAAGGSVELASGVSGVGNKIYGTLIVDAGATDSGSLIHGGGSVTVSAGGAATSETVASGGTLTISSSSRLGRCPQRRFGVGVRIRNVRDRVGRRSAQHRRRRFPLGRGGFERRQANDLLRRQ